MQARTKNLILLITFFLYFPIALELEYISSGIISMNGLGNAILVGIIWIVPCLLFPQATKSFSLVAGIVLLSTSVFNLVYFLTYKQQFSEGALFAIFETNTNEATEYLEQYLTWTKVLAVAVYSLIAVVLWTKLKPVSFSPKIRISIAAVVTAIFLFNIFHSTIHRTLAHKPPSTRHTQNKSLARLGSIPPWNIAIAYRNYLAQLSSMNELLSRNHALPPLKNLTDAEKNNPRTLVLILGESTNRNRMHIYGYPRETTPWLDKIAQDGNLTVFNNVTAPRPYTIEVMQQILTFGDQHHPDAYLYTPSMINLMRQAGYKTFWITNQQTFTERNNMLTTFAKESNQQVFLNNQKDQNARQYDEDTFAPFDRALKDPAPQKFIIVHLLGAHTKFDHRYPDQFNVFKDRSHVPVNLTGDQIDTYNDYDNAILYNDYVVGKLISAYRDSLPNGFLVYLSDHGQEVYDNAQHDREGRDEINPTRSMYTIPFLVWTSPTWKKEHPEDYASYVDRPYSSSHLIQTWSDLANITYDGYKPEESLISPSFNDVQRWIGDPQQPKKLRLFDTLPN